MTPEREQELKANLERAEDSLQAAKELTRKVRRRGPRVAI